MAIIENWHIRSRSHVCSHTGQPFQDGDFFYTCLFEDPATGEFQRRDYSADAWESLHPELANQPFSHWRSKYEAPQPGAAPTGGLQKGDAESLLRRMIDEDDARMDKVRYILVIMLERKKVLKPVGERQAEDRRLLIYEHAKTGEVLMVPDPQIRLEEVEKVQAEVWQLLDSLTGGAEMADDSPAIAEEDLSGAEPGS